MAMAKQLLLSGVTGQGMAKLGCLLTLTVVAIARLRVAYSVEYWNSIIPNGHLFAL